MKKVKVQKWVPDGICPKCKYRTCCCEVQKKFRKANPIIHKAVTYHIHEDVVM